MADLHIHSHYSRATSRDMSPEEIWKWAQIKGITVIGTGDYTHPRWLRELKNKFDTADNGLLILKEEFHRSDIPTSCKSDVFFVLSTEISCIYAKNGKTRKTHLIILSPNFDSAARLNLVLTRIGNLNADGRPILGLDAKELLKIVLDVSPDNLVIPAHAWTPHFSVFGAASGFNSLEECFEDLTPNIYAIETGLSSDPPMNWRLSALDRITLISNSDAHSATKIGREANILDSDISYASLLAAIKQRKGFLGTLEFFPSEGKYHYDGHRDCGVVLSPRETLNHNYCCPVCGKKVTVGVMHRVEMLADREEGYRPQGSPDYFSIIPLSEIIAEGLNAGVQTKKVSGAYFAMLEKLGSEFNILLNVPLDEIERASSPVIREAIYRMRNGNVNIVPGYDGIFGKVKIFEEKERRDLMGQMKLL